jgi:XTP/dITP diphosphohydrolase
MELVFVSGNNNKVKEISNKLPDFFSLKGLKDLNVFDDIPETSDTFKGNAQQKADYIFEKFGLNCFADDSGLEVDALNGAPGVYSARFAGDQKDDDANNQLLISKLKDESNRSARFKTVICLILEGKHYFFEGTVEGQIILEARGEDGFGYDPLFVPNGIDKTFAELSLEEKNQMSHRAQAVEKMVTFLKSYLIEK